MTEVTSYLPPIANSGILAHVVYAASPELASTLGEVLADDQRELIDRRGLTLATRAMRFANEADYRYFKEVAIDRRVRQNADLSRIDVSPQIAWDVLTLQNREINRIYIEPRPIQEIALSGLFAAYAQQEGVPYNEHKHRDRMLAGTLSLTLAAKDLAVGREEGLEILHEAFDTDARRRAMYATYERVATKVL